MVYAIITLMVIFQPEYAIEHMPEIIHIEASVNNGLLATIIYGSIQWACKRLVGF